MKHIFLIFMVIMAIAMPGKQQQAQAIDPVTIAILTPIAIKVAKAATPYILRGLMSGGQHLLSMGGDVIDIFRLPLGALQGTLGMPFGQLGSGVQNGFIGLIAPFKLAFKAITLPLSFFNVSG